MEWVVQSAVEEICSQGANGLVLEKLWPTLHHSLSSNGLGSCDDNIKKALWANLLTIPTLRFESRGVSYDSNHASIHSFRDCHKMGLKLVAAQHLRNYFVGIYDIDASAAGLSAPQRRALERLAIARANGITQSDLAKEFGIKGNNIFYILRNLECRGLIVRQSTILRRKEASSAREPKNSSIVSTNMLYLYRYAKHLGCQQRLEITKEDKNNDNQESTASGSDFVEEHVKEDVHIKDYLPALKAICDKLEETDGKILNETWVIAELLGIELEEMLKDAHMVEDFTAKVNAKDSTKTAPWEDQSAFDADALATENIENIATEPEFSQGLPDVGECKDTQLHPNASQNETSELHYLVPDTELQIVSVAPVSGIGSLDSPRDLSTPRRRRSYQKYPCLTLNALSSLREKRILELLQGEKFMIKADLQRQLQSLEKDKNTMMDRKTLERSLNKLQHEGLCKCIRVGVPIVTNCGRSRTMDIILHPSVSDVSPDLLAQIYERVRSFDMLIRGHGSPKLKKSLEVPELNSVQRILSNVNSDVQSERSEAMHANGFVLAKMVWTKLMHTFLWGYLKSLPSWEDDLSSSKHGYDQNNPHSTCKIFELQEAINAMPLELFLQVAGSTQNFTEMIDKCRNNLLLSDLPVEEYKHLMGTRATGRLSYIIDILRRLKASLL